MQGSKEGGLPRPAGSKRILECRCWSQRMPQGIWVALVELRCLSAVERLLLLSVGLGDEVFFLQPTTLG